MRNAGVVLLTVVSIAYILLGFQLTRGQIIFMAENPVYTYRLVSPNVPGIYERFYINPFNNYVWVFLTSVMVVIGAIGLVCRNMHKGTKPIWIGVIVHAVVSVIMGWLTGSMVPLGTILPMSFVFYQGVRLNEKSPDPNKRTMDWPMNLEQDIKPKKS